MGCYHVVRDIVRGVMHVARQPCCMGRVIHAIHVSLRGTEMEGYIGHAHLEILEVSSSGGQTSALYLCVFVSLCLCCTLLSSLDLRSQSVTLSLISS
jgi:hypothetical protein